MDNWKKWVLVSSCLSLAMMMGACARQYTAGSMNYTAYRIKNTMPVDRAVQDLLLPYADSVNKSMNKVIAEVAVTLDKKQPESKLGNVLADAMKQEGERLYGMAIDAAFVNYGGVRLMQLPAGPLTIGKVFEVMPFDNILVLQKVPGSVVKELLDHIAGRGGWPCSGVQFQIRDKKAEGVVIGGKPLDPNKEYVIANSDFIANGGDDCTMLRKYPQINKGILVRDAFIQYFSRLGQEGKKINAELENRIVNAQ